MAKYGFVKTEAQQMTSFFMKRNSRLGSEGKEIVSFYVLLLIFLAAACFVMAVYL